MSKSVKDRRRDAAIGRRKKIPMTRRPGERKRAAARTSLPIERRSAGTAFPLPGEHPAPLFENSVDVFVELRERGGDALTPADRRLQALGELLCDLLPLGHARH